ncbi:hypothetical protein HanXRQr2_Chr02g0082431 [Helianthus annuus]|uniref:Uncharacterized protein n=1 Tax=Helianthus annuus TaxID=4232 RepID=A0A9K3JSM4_HELAN|nr:hypothetical protein HanXRQr2_Chr02g0082431 [Helianthus annuus]
MVNDVSVSTLVLCWVRYQLCIYLAFVSVLVSVTISKQFVYPFCISLVSASVFGTRASNRFVIWDNLGFRCGAFGSC